MGYMLAYLGPMADSRREQWGGSEFFSQKAAFSRIKGI